MGYYTKYEVTIIDGPVLGIGKNLSPCEHCGRADGERPILKIFQEECEGYDASIEDVTKWYTWERDIEAFSREFPDTVFKITGEGDDHGDVWVAYVKNGKIDLHKAEIKLPLYDPKRL